MNETKADILVVDDNQNNLRTLAAILSKQGYVVRPTISGTMANNGDGLIIGTPIKL